jgi:hypothetical protein
MATVAARDQRRRSPYPRSGLLQQRKFAFSRKGKKLQGVWASLDPKPGSSPQHPPHGPGAGPSGDLSRRLSAAPPPSPCAFATASQATLAGLVSASSQVSLEAPCLLSPAEPGWPGPSVSQQEPCHALLDCSPRRERR